MLVEQNKRLALDIADDVAIVNGGRIVRESEPGVIDDEAFLPNIWASTEIRWTRAPHDDRDGRLRYVRT